MRGRDFLQLILPSQGWYVAFARSGPTRRQVAVSSVDSLMHTLEQLNAKGLDAYHACSSYAEARVWNAHKGKWEIRTHENVLLVRSLWADVDTREVGKSNAPYADREEAYVALGRFCKAASLPLPMVVSSGGGLHLYWPLAEALDITSWGNYAHALKSAMELHGFHADPSRTADASSVLRTPGLTHHKSGRLVECGKPEGPFSRDAFEHLLKGATSGSSYGRPDRPRQNPTFTAAPASPLLGGRLADAVSKIYGNDPSDFDVIKQRCRQLAHFAARPGAYGEPAHYAFAGLAHHCLPRGSAAYVECLAPEWREAGRAKAEQWGRATDGPPTCAAIESRIPGGCDGCPFKGKITSPIILGRGYGEAPPQSGQAPEPSSSVCAEKETPSPVSEVPQALTSEAPRQVVLPAPWCYSPAGQLVFPQETKDGRSIPLVAADRAIYLEGVHDSEVPGRCSLSFQHYLPHHGWLPLTVDAGRMFNGHGIPDLAGGGFVVRDNKMFLDFVRDSINLYNNEHAMGKRYDQCGWKPNNEFLLGTTMITSEGIFSESTSEEVRIRAQWMGPGEGGDPRVWAQTIGTMFVPDNHGAMFTLMCSFGAPFMSWHTKEEGGCVVSLVNRRSGKGKSTILKAAASVWGLMRAFEMSSYDTGPSKGIMLGALCHLPAIHDELGLVARDKDPQLLYNFIMLISHGHDKMRAMQHGEGIRHNQANWALPLLTASNHSIIDHLDVFGKGTDAPGFRILELFIDLAHSVNHTEGDALIANLFENAGWAGQVFMEHLVTPEVMAYARAQLPVWTKYIWNKTGWGAEWRFRVRQIASAALAGDLCMQLGLLRLDLKQTVAWVIEQVDVRKATITVAGAQVGDGIAALSEFIDLHQRATLSVTGAWRPGQQKMPPMRDVFGRLMVRYETTNGRLYTPRKEFQEYVIRQGYSWADVLRELREAGILLSDRKRITLSAGTTLPGGQLDCIEIDMNQPAMSGSLQLVTGEPHAPGRAAH